MSDQFKRLGNALANVRRFYLDHETSYSGDIKSTLRERILTNFSQWTEMEFFLAGSFDFGMAEQGSDIDIYYVGPSLHPDPINEVFNGFNARKADLKHDLFGANLDLILALEAEIIPTPSRYINALRRGYQVTQTMTPLLGLRDFHREISERRRLDPLVDEACNQTWPHFVAAANCFRESFLKYRERLIRREIPIPPQLDEDENKFLTIRREMPSTYI